MAVLRHRDRRECRDAGGRAVRGGARDRRPGLRLPTRQPPERRARSAGTARRGAAGSPHRGRTAPFPAGRWVCDGRGSPRGGSARGHRDRRAGAAANGCGAAGRGAGASERRGRRPGGELAAAVRRRVRRRRALAAAGNHGHGRDGRRPGHGPTAPARAGRRRSAGIARRAGRCARGAGVSARRGHHGTRVRPLERPGRGDHVHPSRRGDPGGSRAAAGVAGLGGAGAERVRDGGSGDAGRRRRPASRARDRRRDRGPGRPRRRYEGIRAQPPDRRVRSELRAGHGADVPAGARHRPRAPGAHRNGRCGTRRLRRPRRPRRQRPARRGDGGGRARRACARPGRGRAACAVPGGDRAARP